MINPIKITLTTAGASTESFSLFSDADGYVTPFATGITKAQLLAGYVSSVAPDLTSVVRVKSNSACMNSIDLNVPATADTTAPSNVATLSVGAITDTTIALSWTTATDNVGIAGYKIYNSSGTLLYTSVGTGLSYTFTGLTPSTAYSYKVKAYDATGNVSASFSNTVTPTTDSLVSYMTLSTTSTSATWSPNAISNGGAILTWDVTGDITPTSQNVNDPTFNLSANTGTVDMNVYDVSSLDYIEFPSNNLIALNVTQSPLLIQLIVASNQLSSIDVSANTLLNVLWCYDNLFAPSATDQVYIDLDANGQSNGTLFIKNNRTSASDTARVNLITKGWTIGDTYTT